MKARGFVAFLVLLGCAACLDARGEVSVKLDEWGEYAGLIVKYVGSNPPRIWTAPAPTATRRPLNPTGDLLGDRAPTLAQSPLDGHPWAVWQHPNGGDLDLVWSRWTGTGWMPVGFVQTDNFTNEYDPRIEFNSEARPYMVWWSSDGQVGTVYFSIFLASRWMTPVAVSAPGSDSRHATLKIQDDRHVLVMYDGIDGRETRTMTLPNVDTITDDIDPILRAEIVIE